MSMEHMNKRKACPSATLPTENRILNCTWHGPINVYNQIQTYVTARAIYYYINSLNPELNLICYLLALLGAHHFLHVSRIRIKLLTFRRLMSYIYIWSTHFLCF